LGTGEKEEKKQRRLGKKFGGIFFDLTQIQIPPQSLGGKKRKQKKTKTKNRQRKLVGDGIEGNGSALRG